MGPPAFLQCIARAVLKAGGNLLGFGLGDVVEQVWNCWVKNADDAARRAELQQLVELAADSLRPHIAAIVRDVASQQPAAVQQRLSTCLFQVPDLVRHSFRRPDDPLGRSVPPGLLLRQASDLSALLTSPPAGPRVTLHFSAGPQAGQSFVFTEPTVLLFGRSRDCTMRSHGDDFKRISRHHCLVEINPPDVRIRDLGSLSGTFVDDAILGKRPKGTLPGSDYHSVEQDLGDGARVALTKLGLVAFDVRIHLSLTCSGCEAVLPDEQQATARQDGRRLCPSCRLKDHDAVAPRKTCVGCRKEVTAERGANRPGTFVCAACRGNIRHIAQTLETLAPSADETGLAGYVLGDELGHGGMGAVFLARHKDTGQHAAIKLMLPRVAVDSRAVGKFQHEIRLTTALRHRHVVSCLAHGYHNGAYFLALEYCDGGSVDKLMEQRGGTLPVDEAVEITLQALEGLDYGHQKGLIHRDIKPANLLLTGWGSSRLVKVGDYGLAKAFDDVGLSGGTRTGDIGGTWAYMCRSQVVDFKNAQPEVDVWALAASLYHMLTGVVPRDFPEGRDACLVVLEGDAVPLRRRNPQVPERLAAVIDEALREEPEIPFKTAAAFKDALEASL